MKSLHLFSLIFNGDVDFCEFWVELSNLHIYLLSVAFDFVAQLVLGGLPLIVTCLHFRVELRVLRVVLSKSIFCILNLFSSHPFMSVIAGGCADGVSCCGCGCCYLLLKLLHFRSVLLLLNLLLCLLCFKVLSGLVCRQRV